LHEKKFILINNDIYEAQIKELKMHVRTQSVTTLVNVGLHILHSIDLGSPYL